MICIQRSIHTQSPILEATQPGLQKSIDFMYDANPIKSMGNVRPNSGTERRLHYGHNYCVL